MKKYFIFIVLFLIIIFIGICSFTPMFDKNPHNVFNEIDEVNKDNSFNTSIIQDNSDNSSEDNVPIFTPIFKTEAISASVYDRMLGRSIPTKFKDKVDLNSLAYLQVSYFGFDNMPHIGEIVVNSKLQNDVLEIFKELYDIHYPIEKIRLIDEYNADDEASMSDNNTSSFCYRVIAGTNSLSNHSKRMCY